MKKFCTLIFSLIITFSFFSCDNEVSTIADYEDITIVYGLLNQNDSISSIKITKAFLGEGNALTYAQVADSSQYEDILAVTLEEYNSNNQMISEIEFHMDSISAKPDGVFYAPNQIIYTAVTNNLLNDQNTYKLVIENRETGKIITATTPLVSSELSILKPPINNALRPTININDDEYKRTVSWESTKNGKRYGVYATFQYSELFDGSNEPVEKSIKWDAFPVIKASDIKGGEELGFDFLNQSFWIWINDVIPYEDEAIENTVQKRYAGKLTFVFEVAGNDFNSYMEVNEPGISIIQERPEFTNIENGTGLLSARFSKERAFDLSEISLQTLWNDYAELKFVNPAN